MVDNLFDLGQDIAQRENRKEPLFDRWGLADGLQPFGLVKRLLGYGVPKARGVEQPGNRSRVGTLKNTNDVAGHADLQPMQARMGSEGVERVGDQVFAATGRVTNRRFPWQCR